MSANTDAIDALQLLRAAAFGGRRVYAPSSQQVALHYRRTWRGVSDVVLVYGVDDAEAYRADDTLPFFDDIALFELASRPDLQQEITGTVVDVVAAVLAWPSPAPWTSHFPSASTSDPSPAQSGSDVIPAVS